MSKKTNHKKKTRLLRRRTKKNKNVCSPFSSKHRVVQGSCFTEHAIKMIATAHNKKNPSNTIPETLTPKEKWMKLKASMSRIPHCQQEECWIDQTSLESADKNKLKAQLFVPLRPNEWEKKPNTWLTNYDIANVLNQYEKSNPEFQFLGPSPIDFDTKKQNGSCMCSNLCNFSINDFIKRGKTKIGIVFNLDRHDQSGSHWVALFVDLSDKFVFYFDSTGDKIHPQIEKLKKTILQQGKDSLGGMTYYVNTHEHQKGNTECGMYCLYFIITCLLRENDDLTGRLSESELVAYFTKKRLPDKAVYIYRHKMFR